MYPHVTSVKSLGIHLELLGSNKSFKKWDLVGEIIGSLTKGLSLMGVSKPLSRLHFIASFSGHEVNGTNLPSA